MNLRKIYYTLTPNMRFVARRLYYLPIDLLETIMGKRSKYEPPKGDIYIGSGDFMQQGAHQLELLKKYIALDKDDCVLDVGSGIGRTAIPLTKFMSNEGSYEGFDVVERGVKWCNEKIKRDFPNFNFLYVPLNNDLYNISTVNASKFRFPYQNNRFNKVFLFSVFTHMAVDEIENYLKEIERVLKPDGLCMATFFIYNPTIEQEISEKKNFAFPIKRDGYRLMNEDVKSANLAMEEAMLDKMISLANLEKVKSIDGFWKDYISKSDDIDFQDIIVLKVKS